MNTSATPPSNTSPDGFVDLRPSRFRARLLFWLTLSVGVHAAAGFAIWASDDLRNFLFQSFMTSKARPLPPSEITQLRYHFDLAARNQIIASNERMIVIARTVERMKKRELTALEQRASNNPNIAAMLSDSQPLLALEVLAVAGNARQETIDMLYARAQRLEAQVFTLYEHFKALNLSSVSQLSVKNGQPVLQPISESLKLCAMEKPPRTPLDSALLALDAEALIRMNAARSATEAATVDHWTRWRDESVRAGDLSQVMANNCERILSNISKIATIDDGGPNSLVPGSGRVERRNEVYSYRGEPMRPEAVEPADAVTSDKKAVITLAKFVGKAEHSHQADYIALDSWWTIGPFEYSDGERSEESLNHAYPPETGVDLDATYLGKENKPLSWNYVTFTQTRMEPLQVTTKAIWYFYCEFWSDEARDVFANVASDDFGKLWLNEDKEAIYKSGVTSRPYVTLALGQFVKLPLRKGTNRILMKLDNFRGTTGFNVVLMLKGVSP